MSEETKADIGKLFEALIGEIKGLREDIKTIKGLEIDPEKLKASTQDKNLPGLLVVQPKNPEEPNLIEPWPPGNSRARPRPKRPGDP